MRAARALGRAAALSLAAGLLAAGCAAAAPGPGQPAAAASGHPAAAASGQPAAAARGHRAAAAAGQAGTAPGHRAAAASSAAHPRAAARAAAASPLPPARFTAGFWSGSDSWPVPVSGSGPYREPSLGGPYGGYVGMAGSWSYWLGCPGSFLAWSAANSAQADADYARYGEGIGTAVYWYMGGPGVDPRYNGTRAEAFSWGARQAARALADMAAEHVTYPVVFMDIELPGIAPAPDNGWQEVYTSPCSGQVRRRGIPAAVDRADFNGFWSYLGAHSRYQAGVYSAASAWTAIFGTGSAGSIPRTYEWTYEPETADLAAAPRGWCLAQGGCAQFFGGQSGSSRYALMWQWSGGGGVRNAIGDFDQIDAGRTP